MIKSIWLHWSAVNTYKQRYCSSKLRNMLRLIVLGSFFIFLISFQVVAQMYFNFHLSLFSYHLIFCQHHQFNSNIHVRAPYSYIHIHSHSFLSQTSSSSAVTTSSISLGLSSSSSSSSSSTSISTTPTSTTPTTPTTLGQGPVGQPASTTASAGGPTPFIYTTVANGVTEVVTATFTPTNPTTSLVTPTVTGTILDFSSWMSIYGPTQTSSTSTGYPLSRISFTPILIMLLGIIGGGGMLYV